MRVFVTGGTGLIGTAVVRELTTHGHSVLTLARSDASAAAAAATGAASLRGGLSDLDVLREGVRSCDAVIHLAFDHSAITADGFGRASEQESVAVAAIGDELRGTDRPFAVVSGTPAATGRPSTEDDPLPLDGPVAGRARTVTAALALAEAGVRTSAIRLPRTVHADGQGGFAGILTEMARSSGVSGIPGDGTQRWPAVHAADAAALFRLALENAPAGTVWHAVADEGDAVRDIAEVIGRRLGVPVEPVPDDTFGALGPVFALDQPASSARTREMLGWTPTHPGLLEDLELI
ncbi:NAD-dependent epimerase/dehydratase family protein [Williamsia deligens]|uniref:NAD-dependent epimerase/dehydratase family protein n=1 Tax=Williamsia deligens TaxID=321325 RepID=A0ABW3G4S6_9NOCA|nr:NAD-dependent epimerase/dehydratase family protein [Williamsia deligens]MCP2194013.1 Nucleoside-diphosphate-sugar epimerase [Williamsia deligens]